MFLYFADSLIQFKKSQTNKQYVYFDPCQGGAKVLSLFNLGNKRRDDSNVDRVKEEIRAVSHGSFP